MTGRAAETGQLRCPMPEPSLRRSRPSRPSVARVAPPDRGGAVEGRAIRRTPYFAAVTAWGREVASGPLQVCRRRAGFPGGKSGLRLVGTGTKRNRAPWLPLQHIHQSRPGSDPANRFLSAVKCYPFSLKLLHLSLAYTTRGENGTKQDVRHNMRRNEAFGRARPRLKLFYCLAGVHGAFLQLDRRDPQVATGRLGEKKIIASRGRRADRRPRLVEIDDQALLWRPNERH